MTDTTSTTILPLPIAPHHAAGTLWTAEDECALVAALKAGESPDYISVALGRTVTSIRYRIAAVAYRMHCRGIDPEIIQRNLQLPADNYEEILAAKNGGPPSADPMPRNSVNSKHSRGDDLTNTPQPHVKRARIEGVKYMQHILQIEADIANLKNDLNMKINGVKAACDHIVALLAQLEAAT